MILDQNKISPTQNPINIIVKSEHSKNTLLFYKTHFDFRDYNNTLGLFCITLGCGSHVLKMNYVNFWFIKIIQHILRFQFFVLFISFWIVKEPYNKLDLNSIFLTFISHYILYKSQKRWWLIKVWPTNWPKTLHCFLND